MGFSSWLRNLQSAWSLRRRGGSGRPARRCRPATSYRPHLEALEARWLPSTLTVLNTSDSGPGSLRAEIAAANPSDQIVFAKSVHTITLTSGEIAISKSLEIEGPGAGKLTISGNNASRVFDISESGTNVEISDLTIANGLASGTTVTGPLGPATLGGGILNNQAQLLLEHVTLANNQAVGVIGGGGGVASIAGATLTVDSSMFVGNVAAGTAVDSPGGGILSDAGSTLIVQQSTFTGNRAIDGGAIGVLGGSQANVSHSTFTNNLARGNDGTATSDPTPASNGGAIFAADESLLVSQTASGLTVAHSTFTGNQARGGNGAPGGDAGQGAGGAISISGGPIVPVVGGTTVADISYSTFTGNQALGGNGGAGGGNGGVGQGGAISQANGTLTLSHSTLDSNLAVGGVGGNGGPGGDGGNGGNGRGGAFVHTVAGPDGASFHPVSTLNDVTMRDNQATGGAGGAGGIGGNGGAGGNGQGGAIRALLGTITIGHSRLLDNQAIGGVGGSAGLGGSGGDGGSGQGGGFLTAFGITAVLSDTALLRNEAVGGDGAAGGNGGDGLGGGIFNGGPSPFGTPDLTLKGCLVALNQADGGAAGAGGSDGVGVGEGGGVFNLGTFTFDGATVITRNDASTSNDDIFP